VPSDEISPQVVQVNLRVDGAMLRRIEDRRQHVGLSRNAWLIKALEWALSQPVKETTVRTTERL